MAWIIFICAYFNAIDMYDWLTVSMNPGVTDGFERSILIRRSKSSPNEVRAYICFAPDETPKQKLIETAGCRWTIETGFKECKTLFSLDSLAKATPVNRHVVSLS